MSRRQDDALSREIQEENRRKKELLRGTLGGPSLLTALSGGPDGVSDFSGVTFAGATTTGGGRPTLLGVPSDTGTRPGRAPRSPGRAPRSPGRAPRSPGRARRDV